MQILRSADRGVTNLGWLDSKHSFAFGRGIPTGPHDMGYRSLRVLNDDRVAPGGGFPEHGHDNMEIISIVLEGGLAHQDSTGASSTITPGTIQRLTAGTGVRHSEYNASNTEPVHFLQIWLHPEREGLEPGYEERSFEFPAGRFTTVAAPSGRDDSITLHQDARLFVARFEPGQSAALDLDTGRHAWVHVARGEATVNGERLSEGDGAAIDDPGQIEVRTAEPTEGDTPTPSASKQTDTTVLVFDLA
ncbi:MAG: pirin family protein [Planctomycetota bacterium]